jgi:NifU-like protein involved in Fe-S cluster formation
MPYDELTLRYFESAACAGVLAGPHAYHGEAGSRALGTWVRFDVQIDPTSASGTIRAARFLAFACPHVIAVSAWLAEQAVGRACEARLPESVHALRARFAVPIEKLGRLLIVEDAWRAAAHAAAAGERHETPQPH